jgi:serine-type D-Ala-D-Ala carboxypeptidase
MSPERVRHIAGLAESWVAQGFVSALVVLVARRGVIVLHEAFGRLTPDADSPALPRDAVFPLTSATKPMTATVVMSLVEDGLLGLTRPVSEYLPEFAGEGKDAVTVHHLLTHTSGLTDVEVNAHCARRKGFLDAPPEVRDNPPPWTLDLQRVVKDEVSLVYDAPLGKAPGEEMVYGAVGYTLLGEIVRRVSGESLPDLARRRLFDPLGLHDTHYAVPAALRPRIVRRPADNPLALLDSEPFQRAPHAPGGVFSTALDTAVFGQLFLNRGRYGDVRVLSPASVAEMTRNQIPGVRARYGEEVFPEASWGLGWDVREDKSRVTRAPSLPSSRTFSHGGAGGVYLWVDPVHEIVGVYLSVVLQLSPQGAFRHCADLFANAVTAAVVDE